MVGSERDQIESVFAGLRGILGTLRRCHLYEQILNDASLQLDQSLIQARLALRSTLVEFYVFILQFLAHAARVFDKSPAGRMLVSLWSFRDFEKLHQRWEKLEARIEIENRVHHRMELSHLRKLVQTLSSSTKDQIDLIPEVRSMVSSIWDQLEDKKRGKILKWVSELDPEDQHNSARKNGTKFTCEWLLKDERYQAWESFEGSAILWLHGIREYSLFP